MSSRYLSDIQTGAEGSNYYIYIYIRLTSQFSTPNLL